MTMINLAPVISMGLFWVKRVECNPKLIKVFKTVASALVSVHSSSSPRWHSWHIHDVFHTGAQLLSCHCHPINALSSLMSTPEPYLAAFPGPAPGATGSYLQKETSRKKAYPEVPITCIVPEYLWTGTLKQNGIHRIWLFRTFPSFCRLRIGI